MSFVSWLSIISALVRCLVKVRRFPCPQWHLSAFGVHDESLKVRVELRHQRVHKVLSGRSSLQHPWHRKTQSSGFLGCVSNAHLSLGKEKALAGHWDELVFYFSICSSCLILTGKVQLFGQF